MIRMMLLLVPALFSAPAFAQNNGAAPTAYVALTTSAGEIVIELERARAPITTGNFLRYVDQKRLDGTSFYRAVKVAPGYGLIQAGTRNDPKRTLPMIKFEPTSVTGLTHDEGTISMARGAAPDTASGDFFITVGKLTSMDHDTTKTGNDALGYAAFGRVVKGMEVVRAILDAPTSPTLGEGVMKGQMLQPQIRLLTARRVAAPPPPPLPPPPPVEQPAPQGE